MTKTLPISARRRFSTLAIILMACTILWLAWTSQQRALLGWILARQTGQAVQIEHLDRFTLGSTIGVSARGIEITGDPHQISIAELALSLQTLPLLTRGELRFESLATRGLRIAVRSDERESPAGLSLSDLPYFSSLSVTDASIRYQSDDQDIQLTIRSLVGNPLPGGDLQFSLDGTLNGHSLTLLARLPATLSTASPDPVSIDLNWGQITGNLTGLIGHPATGRGSDLKVSVSAPRSRALLDALGIPEMRDGPLQINARLLDLGSTLNLESQAAIGDFRIALSGTAADISMNRAEARFSVSGPSLFEAGATLDYPGFESLPFSATGNISRSGTHLSLKQVTLKLAEGSMSLQADLPEYPAMTHMTMDLSGKDFSSTILQPLMGRCELPDTPFNWQASLQRRGTRNQDLTATLSSSGHRLKIEGSLSWSATVARPDLRISSEGFTLSQLGSCFGIADLPDQGTTFSAHVVGEEQALTLSGIEGTSGNLTLDGDIKLKRKPGDSEQALEVELRLQSSNLQESVKAFTAAPVTFYDSPASVSFSVAGTTGNLKLRQAEFNVGDAKGSVSGSVGQLTTLAGLDLSFSFEGEDLNRILVDPERPDTAPVPFDVTGSVKSNGEDWEVEGVEVGIAQTRLKVSGNVPRNRQLSGLRLELAATGKNLDNSLGPWLSQPVPNLPFEMSSTLQFDNDNVSVVLDADVGGHSLKADLLVDNPPDY
ncbi:MAG: hypothetical protein O3B72_06740, partial [Proteobacteria bacterium]|nr:hypothetical protein [Pseudomonadota bacterium]